MKKATKAAYENLVKAIKAGMDYRPEALVLASTVDNMLIAQKLVDDAKLEASKTVKSCTKCGSVHSITDFPKNSRNLDGRDRWCSDCIKAYRAKAKEKVQTKVQAPIVKSQVELQIERLQKKINNRRRRAAGLNVR